MRAADAFALDPQLARDTYLVTDLRLCRVLLMNDRHYPWLIAVPRIPGLTELDELTPAESGQWVEESRHILSALRTVYRPDKLNVAALGNVVAQLHIHHIARFRDDPAWPKPVWGVHPPVAYAHDERDATLTRLRAHLGG